VKEKYQLQLGAVGEAGGGKGWGEGNMGKDCLIFERVQVGREDVRKRNYKSIR